jgi:ABC-type Fe3+-hydroxamate transport system substrate-binding protein
MRLSIFILSVLLVTSCGSAADEPNSSALSTITEQSETMQEIVTEAPTVPKEQILSKGYRTVSLYNNKLRLSVPDYFTEMSSEMKRAKYPRGNSPDVVYTDEDGTVNVAFNYTPTVIKSSDDLIKLSVEYAQQIQSRVEDFNNRTETINGLEFTVFEFISQAIDTRVYNLMFLTELDGRMLLGTFNCTEALKVEWQSIGKEILLSVRKG